GGGPGPTDRTEGSLRDAAFERLACSHQLPGHQPSGDAPRLRNRWRELASRDSQFRQGPPPAPRMAESGGHLWISSRQELGGYPGEGHLPKRSLRADPVLAPDPHYLPGAPALQPAVDQ